jgi:hypothetical protein
MSIFRRSALALLAVTLAPLGAAYADTLGISYYAIAENDQDANHLVFGTDDNEVQATLGANGLPILNTPQYGCTSNCFSPIGAPKDVLADGEITYWSPALNNGGTGGASDVTFTGSSTVTLPFNRPSNFFPPNGTGSCDCEGFQAAVLSGTLDAPTKETISFSIGADDMAFAYLDGQVVCDLGGVHASTAGTCVTPFTIAAGDHTLQVFFVDINESQAGLSFSVNTQGVTTTGGVATPEPATPVLFAAALFGIGFMRRRKRS